MIRTQVYIPQSLYHQAKQFARLNQMTISQLLRVGLERALQGGSNSKDGQQKAAKNTDSFQKSFIGKGIKKKGVDAAVTHDDIYDHVST